MDGVISDVFRPSTRGDATRDPVPFNSFDPFRRRMRRLALAAVLSGAFAALATSALSNVICKPMLSIKYVREIRAPQASIRPWTWSATITADARFCATAAGNFEIDFVRIKEYSPDMQVTEKYKWAPGQFDVSFELAGDESIDDYRIGFIAPCVCRELPWP